MRRSAALAIALIAAACAPVTGPAPVGSPSAAVTPSPGAAAPSPSGPTSPAPPSPDWPTYHRDLARTGVAMDVESFSGVDLAWQTDALDGDVYAEPLVVGGKAIVATERNGVYAFDVRTGAQLWHTTLGQPVVASTLPCGNIRPVTGITGTPAIDVQAGLVYLVAFEQPPLHHELYAIELATGAVRFHRGIDPPGAEVRVHQQRSALALANGNVYVAYGGLAGDCGNYHGWVVGAKAASASGDLLVYQVPTGREGGIWAPSGIAVDGAGRLYAVTGNSDSGGTYDYNDAVVRLSPDLKLEDYWAPADWLALSRTDTDIGSVGPTLLPNGLVVEGGKNGFVYLLRADRLGQIGGELAKLKVCAGIFGGFAFAGGVLYAPCTDGIAAVQVADQSFRLAWRGPRGALGPPIVAGGAVWVTDYNAGILYALDRASGQPRVQRTVGPMQHFTTPTAYGDLVLVVGGGRLVALRMR